MIRKTLSRLHRTLWSLALVLALALPALAVAPSWMPSFPMRMGPNVMLMWAPVPGAVSYNIYRSEVKGELGAKIANVPMNNHMDPNVPSDKDAYYTVKGVMPDGSEGEASPVALLAGIKPLTPPKWAGELYQGGQLNLRWDRVDGAAFYNVFKADKAEGPFNLAGSVQDTKYVDTSLEEGKSYFYQVSAVDRNNVESPRAETKEFKVPKTVAAAVARSYTLTEKRASFVRHSYGSEGARLTNPGDINVYGDEIYVATAGVLMALDANGEMVREFKAPAGYAGRWGQPLFSAMDDRGNLWTTWMNSSHTLRLLAPDGRVLFETNLEKPEEDYRAAGRMADWEKDKNGDVVPVGLAVDHQGRVWVADNFFGQLVVLDGSGRLVKRIGEPRLRSEELKALKGLSLVRFHPQTRRIYALDAFAKVVHPFDAEALDFATINGETVYGWQVAGSGVGQAMLPRGFAVLPDGNLALSDAANHRVQVFSPDWEYQYTLVTEPGKQGLRGLESSNFIAVTRDRRLLVTEVANDRVAFYTYTP